MPPLLIFVVQVALYASVPIYLATLKNPQRLIYAYIYLGLALMVGGFLGAVYSLPLSSTITISGGSLAYGAFMLTIVLLAVREHDLNVVRNIIRTVIAVNVFKYCLYSAVAWGLASPGVINPLGTPSAVFSISARVMVIGGTLIILELLLFVYIFERLRRRISNSGQLSALYVVFFILILGLDGALFPVLAAPFAPALITTILGGARSKLVLAAAYSIPLVAFLIAFRKRLTYANAIPINLKELIVSSPQELIREIAGRQAMIEENTTQLRFQADLLAAVGNAVIATDLDGRVVYWNPAAERLYGWTAAEALGQNVAALTPSEQSQEQAREIMRQLQAGLEWRGEFQVQHKDGHTFSVLVVDTPFRKAGGQAAGIIGVSTDLSEIKRAQAALRLSEARYRTVTENFPDGTVAVYDRDLRMTFVAGRALIESGRPASDFVGKHFIEIAPPETWAVAEPHLRAALAGEVGQYQTPYYDGTYYAVTVAPLPGADGRIEEILVVSQDITRTRIAERAERQRLEEIAQLHNISQAFTQSLDLETIGAKALKTAAALMRADRGAIALLGKDGHTLRLLIHHSPGTRAADIQREADQLDAFLAQTDQGIISWVARHAQPARVAQVKADTRYIEADPTIQSELCVPLQTGGRVIGALNVESRLPAAFSEHDERLLTILSNQVAVSIEKARLFQAEREQRVLAETLRETAEALNSTLDSDVLLDTLLAFSQRVIANDAIDILLLDDANQVQVVRYTGYSGPTVEAAAPAQEFRLADYPFNFRLAQTGRAEALPDTLASSEWVIVTGRRWIRSYMCAPFSVDQRVAGFISVSSRVVGAYSNADAERLQILADQVGFALKNARLFEQIRSNRERVRLLSARLAETEQLERRALARELHDRVGQSLTALGINLNIVRSQLSQQPPEKLAARLGLALETIAEITDRIRDVMAELHPPVLDDYGLEAALRWNAERLEQTTNLHIHLDLEPLAPRLAQTKAISLLRIAQEALMNVAKHAQATRATIVLSGGPATVRLMIADDGVGFEIDAQSPKGGGHWGLLTMRERAEASEGSLRVESKPGEGTRIIVDIPR